jgi:hypothetical protein
MIAQRNAFVHRLNSPLSAHAKMSWAAYQVDAAKLRMAMRGTSVPRHKLQRLERFQESCAVRD